MDEYAGAAQVVTVHHCESYAYSSSSGLPFRQFQFLSSSAGLHETSFHGMSGKKKMKKQLQQPKDVLLWADPNHGEAGDSCAAYSKSISNGLWEGFSFMKRSTTSEAHGDAEGNRSDRIMKPIALRINDEASIRDGGGGGSDAEFPPSDRWKPRKQIVFKEDIIDLDADDTADDQSLSLKLCSTTFHPRLGEESSTGIGAVKNPNANKRFRHSSPTPGNNNNSNAHISNSNSNAQNAHVCQVDDCYADLKHAKDYHRRHRVCELHSKSPQSIVHRVMQRFCQQCSRFHPLQEFDEGKRSCRRRLAGHNKRRRKSHAHVNGGNDVTNTPGNLADTNSVHGPSNTDVLSVVAFLSQLQALKAKEKHEAATLTPEQEVLIQSLKNAALVRDATLAAYQNIQNNPITANGMAPQRQDQAISQSSRTQLGHFSQEAVVLALRNILGSQTISPPQELVKTETMTVSSPNYVTIEAQAQAPSSNEHSSHSLSSPGQSSPEEYPRKASVNGSVNDFLSMSQPGMTFNISSTESEVELGSSPESNYTRSPTEQKLFPTEACSKVDVPRDSEANNMKPNGRDGEFHLSIQNEMPVFRQHYIPPSNRAGNKSITRFSESSESGSDQSPASSSSDGQELTGRIIFKLCDIKRIADIPQDYKSQLQEWLSVTPWFMEEYMRPGCILLTVFVSMQRCSWKEMILDLRGSLKRLLQLSHASVWSTGRIVVQVEQQKALIINGEVKRISYSRIGNGPVLRSVRPVAVEAGKEATLLVHGRNLVPDTKIVCAYHGMYVLHKVDLSACGNTIEQRLQFPGGPPSVFGRCFIEVEHNLLGNALPVIVADREICAELRSLERELDQASDCQSNDMDGFSSDETRKNREAEATDFLHELGWVFQSTAMGLSPMDANIDQHIPDMEVYRFKKLLTYAVLHDWCAVVRKLLDLLFGIGTDRLEEVLGMLSEVNLVHKAVKRKSKAMVQLLMYYVPDGYGARSMKNIFTPTMCGPAGFTPLHVAACTSGAEDVLDALTNDPHEVGLQGWDSVRDFEGLTPEWHARIRGNVSYLKMVERKRMMMRCHDSPFVSLAIQEQNPKKNNASISRDPSMLIELPRVANNTSSCRNNCRYSVRQKSSSSGGSMAHLRMHRPLLLVMVAVAAICATVAVFFKTPPHLESVLYSLKWEGINYGFS